ncbi:MAG: putative metal-binding motif-containing protein, partial [Sandaracinus sp.]|nr:putative metal-binding motif-containing protein [Sandaracinus sp.]
MFRGSREICDPAGVDEDCDPTTVGDRDADRDGYEDAACCNGDVCGTDCNDGAPNVHPTAPEVCNGRDDDCDGSVDEGV